MAEWRNAGPLAVLLDVLSSIRTPQARELLAKFEKDEAIRLGQLDYKHKEVVRPVKTRWNSFLAAFERAIELRQPLDDYMAVKIQESVTNAVPSRQRYRSTPRTNVRLFIAEGGLTSKDWATITEYVELLKPFKEATTWMEGRGKAGNCGAIWEVLPTFDYLVERLDGMILRLEQVDFTDEDAPEDHLLINLRLAYLKVAQYYKRFEETPAYYVAACLHPSHKSYFNQQWKVPIDWAEDEPHPRTGWLEVNNRGFQQLWQARKEEVAIRASPEQRPPAKKQRIDQIGYALSRSEHMAGVMREAQITQHTNDEYEEWKTEAPLGEAHPLAIDPVRYWLTKEQQYPILSQFALDILSIPASSADCERTFSELGDLLGVRRLRMLPDLLSALQSLRSWKRIGIQRPKSLANPTKNTTAKHPDFTVYQLNKIERQFTIDN